MKDIFVTLLVASIPAIISGLVSLRVARNNTKAKIEELKQSNKNEIDRLVKQHEADLESLELQHKHEIEKLELEHAHELKATKDAQDNEAVNKLLSEALGGLFSSVVANPAMEKAIADAVKNGLDSNK